MRIEYENYGQIRGQRVTIDGRPPKEAMGFDVAGIKVDLRADGLPNIELRGFIMDAGEITLDIDPKHVHLNVGGKLYRLVAVEEETSDAIPERARSAVSAAEPV